jgi:hypothetical protein
MVQRHLFEKPERAAQLLIDRRAGVVVQNTLRQVIVLESGRRDRGVSVRSKLTVIQSRHKGGKQFALANRPFRRPAHHRLGMRRMGPSEKVGPVPQCPDDVGCPKSRRGANNPVQHSG